MKLLQECDFENIKLNDIIYIEESLNKKYKYIGTFISSYKNLSGIGYWLHFSVIKCVDTELYKDDCIFSRFSLWNNFYKPEKETILNNYLQNSLNKIINVKTNRELLLLDKWF
jgi:hypothetical protein